MQTPQVTLYTRRGCHLCHQAKVVLDRFGLAANEIDIDHDSQLLRRYNESVPVVVINGQERFFGRVDEVLLRRILAAESLG